jgi:molybdopterin converting factor small subunit
VAKVTVRLHGAFREFAGGARSAAVDATDVAGALAGLVAQHPTLAERLRDEHGRLREHLNIFANDEDLRFLDGERTALRDGDVVHIVPAVSGGER